MKFKSIAILLLLLTVGIQSCVPARQVRAVNKKLPQEYNNAVKDTFNSASIAWRAFFAEPELNALIDSALVNNQELNILLQKVAIANNEIKARKGEYLPFVNYRAGAEVDKVGEYTRNGAIETNLPVKDNKMFPEPFTNYSAGLVATWELDVWKKLRNSKKAAVMEYLSTVEGKHFMVTNLIAEIANAYYELVALDNQLVIINQNLEIQQKALKIVKLQKEAARTTELAVKRFEAEVLKNQSEKYDIKQQIIEVENQINFLIGKQPATIVRHSTNFLERSIDTVMTGIPPQLLGNRPDIRKAEYELAAAKLDVKVARAKFYPSFGLKAGIGLEAFKPKYLVSGAESLLYNLGGDIVGPLINRNAIKAEYNTANAKQLATVYEYEKAILNGYIEVANELSNIENLKKSYVFKSKEVEALTKSIEISNKLYQSARADYMEVLLTQRDALESKIKLVDIKKEQLLARINVYRALGGGWR